ncbi:glycosyltransferase [Francisella philomiragia]|uniref:glycosyltransferase n=1 Tax=Francisella philomiragia TaxID=28110 RepID=UPI0019083E8B|nr:glycosyltransferase [Francisella philomiragia]MBK2026283.1 glycosyltransferase [Francisella philomiragia]
MSTNKDLISVVVPAYNHEKYVAETIESIVKQTYENIELIIINDGSTDNTSDQIKATISEHRNRFQNIKFIDNNHNQGVVKSLNEALKFVKGRYVSICASDDVLLPNNFQVLHSFLSENNGYVLAVGDNEIIDSDSNKCYWTEEVKNTYDIKSARFKTYGDWLKNLRKNIDFLSEDFGKYELFLEGTYIPNGYMIRKSIFIDILGGYSENDPLEDFSLHLHLSRYGKYKYIDEILFRYRWHDTNSVKNVKKMHADHIETLYNQKEFVYKNGYEDIFKYPHLYAIKYFYIEALKNERYSFDRGYVKKLINKFDTNDFKVLVEQLCDYESKISQYEEKIIECNEYISLLENKLNDSISSKILRKIKNLISR